MNRSILDILADAKRLAIEYYERTGKPLGITGEVAEFEAARALALDLVEARTEGYDAVRKQGATEERIQIKGRRLSGGLRRGRMPAINLDKEFDTVLLVLLDESYDPVEMWEASRDAVEARLRKPGSKARNERRQLAVTQFVSIAARVWPVVHPG